MKLSRATACATMMLVAALGVLVSIAPALANWTGLDASGKVITFFNTNPCTSVVCVPIAQPVDTSGNAFGVSANPFFISPASGATFPVSAISFPLPTGASTSALQTTGNTSLASILTALGSPFQAGGSIGNTAFGLNAGTNDIGGVYTTSFSASVTPTVTSGSAYSAGNEVGGLMTFTSVTRSPKFSGKVDTVSITSKTVQTAEFDLYLCDQNPSSSTWTDKSTPAINSADVTKCKWMIPLTANASGLGTQTNYTATGLGLSFALPSSGTSLYGVLVTPQQPSANFGSTSDLTVTIAGPED